MTLGFSVILAAPNARCRTGIYARRTSGTEERRAKMPVLRRCGKTRRHCGKGPTPTQGHITMSPINDEQLLCQFENCSLPKNQWTHTAHVRVAYLYLRRQNPDDVINK